MFLNVQLYGPVRKAPELTGASPSPTHTDHSQQLATSQQLASCLATPFTGKLSEILLLCTIESSEYDLAGWKCTKAESAPWWSVLYLQ